MKRAMLSIAAAALASGPTACSPNPPQPAGGDQEAAREWARPPVIEGVERARSGLIVSGVAGPAARVVLRGDDGAAFAATADPRGRFEIRVPSPAAHLLLRPETEVGQDPTPSPDRLLILAGGDGPMAVLRPGGAARRLDAAPALGAVDSDGRMRLASGRATPGTAVVEVQSGGEAVQVVPGPRGFWSVILPTRDGPDQVRVAGVDFPWPGEAAELEEGSVERMASGWRIHWSGPAGEGQTTWLPDARGR